ncbi:MAG: ROK family protein [Erysipelotrichaceae bacterium]|nr:ROK family protein [Erysipelotrichaceae bacterium]MBR3167997.1 ROK family protein [Erysipelotrichaceae bacterium]
MNKPYKICLDIGGTKILGVIFNENNEIIYRLKKRTKGSGEGTENVEQVIISVVAEMVKKSGISLKQVQGIAAGAPGVIDQENGIILFSPNLPWRDYDIRTPLEKKFKVPFYIGNDVNIGILGEYKHGAGRGYTNVVGFFVGTGMGGGLILDGKLYTGSHFKGAEYGHMILDPEGPVCNCGQRGCLEAFSSKQGITKYIRRQASRGRETMMAEHLEGGTFRSKYLKQALRKKDPVTVEAVNRACHWLAVATGNMINTFSPDVVIYGGGVVEATGDIFVNKILKEVDNYCMPSIRSTVELKSAALGDDSIVYGALSLIEDAQAKRLHN